MANRHIPYGYKCKNGIYKADEAERLTLDGIFGSYLAGKSLMQIAESLNQAEIPYYFNKCGWNKARIKRIIEDKRYLGNETFPQLISDEIFGKVGDLIGYKSPGYNIDKTTALLKGKAFCMVCGSRMIYNNKYHGFPKWECSSPECREERIIKAPAVEKELICIINAVIANPKLLEMSNAETSVIADNETGAMLNEINRRMNQRDIEFTDIQKLIFDYADTLYQKSNCGINQKLTKTLKRIFTAYKPADELDAGLFGSTVSSFTIAKDSTVEISFINGAVISQNIIERSNADAEG